MWLKLKRTILKKKCGDRRLLISTVQLAKALIIFFRHYKMTLGILPKKLHYMTKQHKSVGHFLKIFIFMNSTKQWILPGWTEMCKSMFVKLIFTKTQKRFENSLAKRHNYLCPDFIIALCFFLQYYRRIHV